MNGSVKENLEIHNFLSIKHINWDVNQFNIITGDVGSGKSLCIKLLQFFEDIIPSLLILPYDDFFANLDIKSFFQLLTNNFNKIFAFSTSNHNGGKPHKFKLSYTFSYDDEVFDVSITGHDERDVSFESNFLESLLPEWKKMSQKKLDPEKAKKITLDGAFETKRFLYKDLLKRFGSHLTTPLLHLFLSRSILLY